MEHIMDEAEMFSKLQVVCSGTHHLGNSGQTMELPVKLLARVDCVDVGC